VEFTKDVKIFMGFKRQYYWLFNVHENDKLTHKSRKILTTFTFMLAKKARWLFFSSELVQSFLNHFSMPFKPFSHRKNV